MFALISSCLVLYQSGALCFERFRFKFSVAIPRALGDCVQASSVLDAAAQGNVQQSRDDVVWPNQSYSRRSSREKDYVLLGGRV